MKLRILAIFLLCIDALHAQHKRFSWQDACFKNPALPYCPNADFWAKRPASKDGKSPGNSGSPGSPGSPAPDAPETVTPSVIVAGAIDWRFADPSADALIGLHSTKLSSSPLGRDLVGALASRQGLNDTDVKHILDAFSGADQVVLSIHGSQVSLMSSGRTAGSAPPALESGWKAVPLVGNALLIGPADAVEQAMQRISAAAQTGELARLAARQAGSDLWAVSATAAEDSEAAAAGAKWFSLTASIGDRVTIDEAFEFEGEPDAAKVGPWLKALGPATLEGNVVHRTRTLETTEAQQWLSAAPIGKLYGVLIQSARTLPGPAVAAKTKPVIFGLDDGPQEVKQYFPPAPPPSAQSPGDLSGEWLYTHQQGHFQGTIIISQNGSTFTGTWHTGAGKSEPDTPITGRIDGNTVTFTRFVGSNQTFTMTLSADGKRLDGFGEGFFLNHTNLNMQRGVNTYPGTPAVTPVAAHQGSVLSSTPPRGAWRWAIQSVAGGSGPNTKYSSFYYEAATDRSVERPLNLTVGGTIVGVFPNDCTFSVRSDLGDAFTFRDEPEAKGKTLGPGAWSVYPLKCSGVVVFIK